MLHLVDYIGAAILHAIRVHGKGTAKVEFIVRAKDTSDPEWKELSWEGNTMDAAPAKQDTVSTVIEKAVEDTPVVPMPTPKTPKTKAPAADTSATPKKKPFFGGSKTKDWINEKDWIGEAEYYRFEGTGNQGWYPVAIIKETDTHYTFAPITVTSLGRAVRPGVRMWPGRKVANKKLRNVWIYSKAKAA